MRSVFLAIGITVLSLSLPVLATQQSDDPIYKAGDGVTMPRVISEVHPSYTPDAMKDRVQGSVQLACVVDKQGQPTRIEVIRSLDERLDAAAVKALQQWRFEPGKKGDAAVAVRIEVEMTFTLR